MNKKQVLTQEYLKECLTYNPETGIMIWNTRPLNHFKDEHYYKIWNKKFSGKESGCIDSHGYRLISIDKKQTYRHRLAWLYVYGYFPPFHTDHINSDVSDDRICNLREATNPENSQNLKKPNKNNSSGFLGVRVDKRNGLISSRIMINYKEKFLGYFDTREEAYNAYVDAKRQLHPFGML
jgi:hypothetical protein